MRFFLTPMLIMIIMRFRSFVNWIVIFFTAFLNLQFFYLKCCWIFITFYFFEFSLCLNLFFNLIVTYIKSMGMYNLNHHYYNAINTYSPSNLWTKTFLHLRHLLGFPLCMFLFFGGNRNSDIVRNHLFDFPYSFTTHSCISKNQVCIS